MIRRIRDVLVTSGGVLGITLALPSAGHAQGRFELTPFFATYYSLLTMANDVNGDGSNVRVQQTAAPTFGGRLTFWFSNTLGAEASAGYSSSGIRAFVKDSTSGGLSFSITGNMTTASGRLLYRPARTNLHFIIGGGIVHRGGDFWKGTGAKLTSPAGVLGVGVRAGVTPKFALNVSLEANLYSYDLDGSDPTNKAKFQSDVLLAIGLPITLSR